MARGWESKSVESQIDDASAETNRGAVLTREERLMAQKRQSLDLSRRRVLHDIEAASSEARRAALRQALAFLDEEIGKLGQS
jgi:hypothetical protein